MLALARLLLCTPSWHPRACCSASLPNRWTQAHGRRHQADEGCRVKQALVQASRECTHRMQSCHRVPKVPTTELAVHGGSHVVRAACTSIHESTRTTRASGLQRYLTHGQEWFGSRSRQFAVVREWVRSVNLVVSEQVIRRNRTPAIECLQGS